MKNSINIDKAPDKLKNIEKKDTANLKIIKFNRKDFLYYPRINKYNDKRKINKLI